MFGNHRKKNNYIWIIRGESTFYHHHHHLYRFQDHLMIISFNFCFLFSRLQLSSVHLIFRTKQEFFFSTNQTKIIWLQRSNELNEAPAMIEVFIIRIINDHHHYISSFSILSEEYTHTHTHITFSFHSLSSSLSLRMNVCC